MRLPCTLVLLLFVLVKVTSAEAGSSVPQGVVDSWSYLIGNWDVSGEVGSTSVKGKAAFEWGAGKSCYLGKQVWQLGPDEIEVQLALIGGWDAAASQVVEYGFASSGESGAVHYVTPPQNEFGRLIEGRIDGVNEKGERWNGDVTVDRTGPNEFRLTTTIDGEVVHSLKYVRRDDGDGAQTR